MSTVIKAKPTVYQGTRFRSRLEARWAAFFDAIGREWAYEPKLPELQTMQYQPDFLTDDGADGTTLIEVKPAIDSHQTIQLLEDAKWQAVAEATSCDFVLLIGDPGDWVEGQLVGVGHIAALFTPGKEWAAAAWAECNECQTVRVWTQGIAGCHKSLPSGPMLRAMQAVRDMSFEQGGQHDR